MSKIVILLVLMGVVTLSAPAYATEITFDDIAEGYIVPDGYQGFDWDNMLFVQAGSGYFGTGLVSSPYVAINQFGDMATMSSATQFSFNGGTFTGGWNDGLTLTITGYLGSAAKFTKTVILDTATQLTLAMGWGGIDRVTFASSGGVTNPELEGGGTHFVVDNIHVNEYAGDMPNVPLPAALPLFGTGLLALAARARKRKSV